MYLPQSRACLSTKDSPIVGPPPSPVRYKKDLADMAMRDRSALRRKIASADAHAHLGTEPLPVDLVFDVEFRREGTGEIFPGSGMVVLKDHKVEGSFTPDDEVTR